MYVKALKSTPLEYHDKEYWFHSISFVWNIVRRSSFLNSISSQLISKYIFNLQIKLLGFIQRLVITSLNTDICDMTGAYHIINCSNFVMYADTEKLKIICFPFYRVVRSLLLFVFLYRLFSFLVYLMPEMCLICLQTSKLTLFSFHIIHK